MISPANKNIRIAILSDLHAARKGDGGSATDVKLFTDDDGASPLADLIAHIKKTGLRADYIVCPGDMTNKADPQALRYVWDKLHDLKSLLKAKSVFATVGNHDVDSRGHGPDLFPRESLMRLSPSFPASNDSQSNYYWAHGYFIRDCLDARFLVVNSCWLHESRDEVNRGAVTSYTIEKINEELRGLPKKRISIAICHHHPHPHAELGLGSDDVMRNGQRLLDTLSENGDWLLIHGHKHHPKIEYAQGQHRQPVVLACGSFSGRIEGDNAAVSGNYFHLVEVGYSGGEIDLFGTVSSLAWASGLGWSQYSHRNGFPTELGFGYTGKIALLAEKVKVEVNKKGLMRWADLALAEPSVKYLMPKQLRNLLEELDSAHALTVTFDGNGLPAQVGPKL